MRVFADIHIHILPGVDDGPQTAQQMQKLLDSAYRDGTRVICVTPHFHPGMFGDNIKASAEGFRILSEYAGEKYPDLKLVRGNELRYSPNCIEWLNQSYCRTMNGTNYVLVDFSEHVNKNIITDAVHRLLNSGYRPILAHVERYRNLSGNLRDLIRCKESGALLQVDGPSLFGGWGLFAKNRSRKIIAHRLADLVCSDAHNVTSRPPQLFPAFAYIQKRCGETYAVEVLYENALRLLNIQI